MPIKPRSLGPERSPHSPDSSSLSDLWEDVLTQSTRRSVCMEINGDTDTGKSTLALTAPGPIAYIHAYEKLEGIIQSARRSKDIKACKFGGMFRGDAEEVQVSASMSVERLERAISDAYKWARTIILDTHTESWTVYQLARLGSLTRAERSTKDNKRGQLVYTEINNRWNTMLKEFRIRQENPLQSQPTNLILIGQTKDEYRKSQVTGQHEATGKTIRAGQKGVGYFCDLIVRTSYDKKAREFKATIEKPWYNNDMRGFVVSQESGLLSFPGILGLVTETDSEEWG